MQPQANTHATAIARNIQAEISAFMIERGNVTRDELLQRFTPEQIDRYAPAAARAAARRADHRAN